MREKEGSKLKEDIEKKCTNLEELLCGIEEKSTTLVEQYRTKLKSRIDEFLSDTKIDENRLAIEVAILCDKACIDEEIVRLKSHISQFKGYTKF